jgi:hypothetical protein
MVSRRRAAVVSLVALGTAAALAAAPSTSTAATTSGGVGVVTSGLDMPFGLQKAIDHGGFVVAESESGQVTRVFKTGRKHAILDGVPGVAGVGASSTKVFAVIGGPNEEGSPSGGKYGPSRVLRMNYHGKHVTVLANLLRYERKHNPDGQKQFAPDGTPYDALSNPFAMTWSRFGLFVADGGANDVLKVNPRTGKVTTFFVPPTVKIAACKDAQANPGTEGCDPVPTGVQVRGDHVYVSTLGAEVPGAGRIYMLDAHTGKVQAVWRRLTAPTGLAVRKDNTVYYSEVFFGAPAEGQEPPPGFQPSDIGRITRVRPGGGVRHADVTMPTGLVLKNGRLYSTAWSVASFFGIPHAGQVVRVKDLAFH